nr:hypothetical protein [Tanacetum cinerariifolium]
MFGVNDLDGDEVVVKDAKMLFDVADDVRGEDVFVSQEVPLKEVNVVAATTITATIDDITLAKALMEIESAKPKAATTTAVIIIITASIRPKAKGLVIHEQEQKDQLMLDEEVAFKLQAEKEEERLAREKAQQIKEVNKAWDDIQAKIDTDYQLAQRLQAEEQEESTDEEKARLFVQFLKKRRKFFVAKRAEEKRNKPPIRTQQRSIMCTYLKNMEGWKLKRLKNNSKEAETEVIEGSSKRAGEELEQENAKKKKMEDDKESIELKQCLKMILEDEDDVTIDATPLSSNSPTSVDYKIPKEEKKSISKFSELMSKVSTAGED